MVAQMAPADHAIGNTSPAVTNRSASTHEVRSAMIAVRPKAAASAGPAENYAAEATM